MTWEEAVIFLYVGYGSISAMMIILTWMAMRTYRHNREAERQEAEALKKKEASQLLNNS